MDKEIYKIYVVGLIVVCTIIVLIGSLFTSNTPSSGKSDYQQTVEMQATRLNLEAKEQRSRDAFEAQVILEKYKQTH
jgi:hypothetical protein